MGFHFISQLDQSDCGAACLAMVARSYRLEMGIGTIREVAGTNSGGTSFAGMVSAARVLGFNAHALDAPNKTLPKNLPLPAIFNVRVDGQYHFIVCISFTNRKVKIADPASGIRRISLKEFLNIWTGSFIIMSPGPNYAPSRVRTAPLLKFLPLMRPFLREFLEVILSSIILILFGISQFLYIRFIIDSVLSGNMVKALHVVSVGMIVLVIFQNILAGLRQYTLCHIGSRVDLSIALLYFKKVVTLPQAFFDKRRVGEILTRMEDGRRIREVLSGLTLSAIIDSMLILGVGAFLFSQSPVLTITSLLSVPFFAVIVIVYRKPFNQNNNKAMSLHASRHAHLVESLSGMFHIKAFHYEEPCYEYAEKKILSSLKQDFKLEVLGITQGGLLGLVEAISQILLFWIGGWLILQGELSIGQLISFNALMGYLIGPLKRLFLLQPQLQSATVAARRLISILELPSEAALQATTHGPLPVLTGSNTLFGEIEFKNCSFSYGLGKKALHGFNLHIRPGEKIGLVGHSGSGKSTIVKLLLKLYQPSQGQINFDSRDSRSIDSGKLREQIGYVPQNPHLFSGSIMENLIIGLEKPNISDVLYACSAAQALSFIQDLPDGFGSEVGDGGGRLSGGERQRLAIARALLRKPRILVLDEATSALDSHTESAFQRFLDSLEQVGTTIIIIAHRLATIQNCNKIIVLDKGAIAEEGTHSQLIDRETGIYRELWQCQARSIPDLNGFRND